MSGLRHPSFLPALLAMVLVTMCAQARAAPRVALVIGNAAYEHTTPLRNPRNDATDVARALEGLGFEVIEGLDLDEAAFESKLREFAQAARGAEVTLFFYAGHGLQVEGENYLVPIDAKLAEEVDLRLEAFELAAFLRQMRGATNLVFLDACRDNPLARDLARSMGPTRSTAVGRGLSRVETASGTLIAYATQPGNVADDGADRNSPFTGALLAHIATPGLSVNDLLTSVTDAVVTGTAGRQQPWTHSSLRKPFHFKPEALPAPAPEVPEGVREAYAAAERVGTAAAFRMFVEQFPASAEAREARARIAALEVARVPTEIELLFWESVKDSAHAADIQAYLDQFPDGAYVVLARNRLARLGGAVAAAGAPGSVEAERLAAEREFWASVKGSEDPAELRAYLERYPDGAYAVLARARIERLEGAGGVDAVAAAGGAAAAAPGAEAESEAGALPADDGPARTRREDGQHPPTKKTWKTRSGRWTIELTMDGHRVDAILSHSTMAQLSHCRGKVDSAKRIVASCEISDLGGYGYGVGRLAGTFPNLVLQSTGQGVRESFVFGPDKKTH